MNLFSTGNLFSFFFKAFAVTLSVFYLVYAIVIFRQAQVMVKTLEMKNNWLVVVISFIQVLVGIALIILSLTIL